VKVRIKRGMGRGRRVVRVKCNNRGDEEDKEREGKVRRVTERVTKKDGSREKKGW